MLKQESLLDTYHLSATQWFIIFEHGDMPYAWAKFLKRGFRHCYAIQWDGFNWIRFLPRLGHTDIEILPYNSTYNIMEVVQNIDSCIIHIKVKRDSTRVRAPWPTVSTCVEQIKAILGVKKWFLFTPWQLFKYLEKQNGFTILKT